VAYVGDQVCAGCHAEHAESYGRHPMGRSLAPIRQAPPLEQYDPPAHDPFEALGFQFAVERRGDRVWHRARQRTPGGEVVTEGATELQYVLGSGARGRSYLQELGGTLYLSPISWYSQQRVWDLSPGFEVLFPVQRAVEASCLFCHANQVQPVPHTRNRYREPI